MSMHKLPLSPHQEAGLRSHGLPVGTPSQLSDAFLLGMAWAAPTTEELQALGLLLALARAAYWAMDDSEQMADGSSLVPSENADSLSAALDALDDLPDDQPNCYMLPGAKAAWALRRLLGTEE